MIEKEAWRIKLSSFEEGVYGGGGFVHPECASEYFGTSDILTRVKYFAQFEASELAALEDVVGGCRWRMSFVVERLRV
ncbi:MAG: hypothetical protein QF921_05905 [Pseudomonadales bacterium]|jgi:hypothetical protein|nr:hypothetical protein [Pseudomonadales bacterium]MDP6826940.1 hypothetical protein [Pseudomonadales bacterium]MDP6971036.1 hypothetical protein [Pseudomonadales bacterium]|tara:strand:- start:6468 stop:6701 length:234 start_codon:yes stop_codon:yes gene_type:complete